MLLRLKTTMAVRVSDIVQDAHYWLSGMLDRLTVTERLYGLFFKIRNIRLDRVFWAAMKYFGLALILLFLGIISILFLVFSSPNKYPGLRG